MILLSDLPTDANGITQGAWRLIHVDPTYRGSYGLVEFVDGVGQTPIAGRQLRFITAEHGSFLFLEPWGDLPPGWELPELVSPTVPDEARAHLQLAPWRAQVADKILTLEDELAAARKDGATVTSFDALRVEVCAFTGDHLREARNGLAEGAEISRGKGFPLIGAELDKIVADLDVLIAAENALPKPEAPEAFVRADHLDYSDEPPKPIDAPKATASVFAGPTEKLKKARAAR